MKNQKGFAIAIPVLIIAALAGWMLYPKPVSPPPQSQQAQTGNPSGACLVQHESWQNVDTAVNFYCDPGTLVWTARQPQINSAGGTVTATTSDNWTWNLEVTNPATAPISCTSSSISATLLALGSCASATATCTGAAVGMVALTNPHVAQSNGIQWQARVTSANTVTAQLCGLLSVTTSATVMDVRVLQ